LRLASLRQDIITTTGRSGIWSLARVNDIYDFSKFYARMPRGLAFDVESLVSLDQLRLDAEPLSLAHQSQSDPAAASSSASRERALEQATPAIEESSSPLSRSMVLEGLQAAGIILLLR
jgi:hypothetical protein